MLILQLVVSLPLRLPLPLRLRLRAKPKVKQMQKQKQNQKHDNQHLFRGVSSRWCRSQAVLRLLAALIPRTTTCEDYCVT